MSSGPDPSSLADRSSLSGDQEMSSINVGSVEREREEGEKEK